MACMCSVEHLYSFLGNESRLEEFGNYVSSYSSSVDTWARREVDTRVTNITGVDEVGVYLYRADTFAGLLLSEVFLEESSLL